jgi:RepB DNA-primase from phage plasmid
VHPVDKLPDEMDNHVHAERPREHEEMSQNCYRSERRDRSFVRRALRRGVPTQAVEDRLLRATEFRRLNPERDPMAYVRGLIDEEGSGSRSLDMAETPTADSSAMSNDGQGNLNAAGKEHAIHSEAMARRYIQENFEAADWLAVVVRNRETGITLQRITTARQIASPEFQSWLRHKNAHGSDIYLSLNTLKDHARGRTKGDIKEIRHLYLDLDVEGQRKLAAIYETPTVPHPNCVLQTSADKYQVLWRVEAIPQNDAEDLLRGLAERFGGDSAATDSTRVFRLPGFNNKKYEQDFPVTLGPGMSPEPVYHRSDFRIQIVPRNTGTTTRTNTLASAAAGSESANTQSERDWAYAVRHLRRGDDPEDIIREIAAYRATDRYDPQDAKKLSGPRKANPRYYAERTVARAMGHLGITSGSDRSENMSPEAGPSR